MVKTRYSESRILVRRLQRPPGQSSEEFKANVRRLRKHFQQFNLDVSHLCQWLMTLRPGGKNASPESEEFWKFFLETENYFKEEDKADRARRMVFDVAVGLSDESSLACLGPPEDVKSSVPTVAVLPRTDTAQKLFERYATLENGHKQVLLKATADWVVAHYWRSKENWGKAFKDWLDEKAEWESRHPDLNESIRSQFNDIFEELNIKKPSPRVCTWERLKEGKDDCEYGERLSNSGFMNRHGQLCVRYKKFSDSYFVDEKGKYRKHFLKNAYAYLKLRKAMKNRYKEDVMKRLVEQQRKAGHFIVQWFPEAWGECLKALEITEDTILNRYDGLPHCALEGDRECEHLTHTNECTRYRTFLFDHPELQQFDSKYRKWRKEFLRGPRVPSFHYPSAHDLPMPKIFGKGFFRPADFENSVIELRLDDMPGDTFLRFGFASWPRKYPFQPGKVRITSVHITFIGTRARVGFRFRTKHEESRLKMSQDEIDKLRSEYRRQSQDQIFLDKASEGLRQTFEGDFDKELRLLAVDLGTEGGAVALFNGRSCYETRRLKIIKLAKLGDESLGNQGKKDKKGLTKYHLKKHIKLREGLAERLHEKKKTQNRPIGDHDLRHLHIHIRGMMRDWVRLNVSQIMKIAKDEKVDLIVFESHRGWKFPGYDKIKANQEKGKLNLAFLAHGRIRHKTAEKAVEQGMRMIPVPYMGSSQRCAECGWKPDNKHEKKVWKDNKHRRRFVCGRPGCGHETGSDENAAHVLGRVFWGEINLPVEPEY